MKTIKGDLVELALDGHFDFIVHGCNCFHTMGAGIARQIAEAFPGETGPAEVDKRTPYGAREKIGFFSFAFGPNRVGGTVGVFNAYTQFDLAQHDGDCVVDYEAVRKVFRTIGAALSFPQVTEEGETRLGVPAIGAGLAGGDWDVISAIIQEELDAHGIDWTYVEYAG